MEEKKKENGKERKMNEIKTAVLFFGCVFFAVWGIVSSHNGSSVSRFNTLSKVCVLSKIFLYAVSVSCIVRSYLISFDRGGAVMGQGRGGGGGCTVDCVNWQNRGFHSTMVEKIQSTLCTVRTRPLLQSFVPTFLLLWIVFQLLCVNHSAFEIWDGMGEGAEAQNCKPHSKMHACACAPRLLHVLWRLSRDR